MAQQDLGAVLKLGRTAMSKPPLCELPPELLGLGSCGGPRTCELVVTPNSPNAGNAARRRTSAGETPALDRSLLKRCRGRH